MTEIEDVGQSKNALQSSTLLVSFIATPPSYQPQGGRAWRRKRRPGVQQAVHGAVHDNNHRTATTSTSGPLFEFLREGSTADIKGWTEGRSGRSPERAPAHVPPQESGSDAAAAAAHASASATTQYKTTVMYGFPRLLV